MATNGGNDANDGRGKKNKNVFFKLANAQPVAKARTKRPSKAPDAPDSEARFYEKYGLRVPLFANNGKKRPHARASASLRNKSEDAILDIVEEYIGVDKRNEFKTAKKSKAWISNWIEMAETLALGPSPSTKLKRNDWTGKSPEGGTEQPRSSKRPKPNARNVEDDIKDCTKNGAKDDIKTNTKNGAKNEAKDNAKKVIETTSTKIAKKKTQSPRAIDSAAAPARQQQTANAAQPSEQYDKQDPEVEVHNHGDDIECEVYIERMPNKGVNVLPKPRLPPSPLLQEFLDAIGLTATNDHQAVKIIDLGTRDGIRIITSTAPTTPSSGPSFHNTKLPPPSHTIYTLQVHHDARPFLKQGRHGPHGDFAADSERATGRGHTYDPADLQKYEDYLKFRAEFHNKYPGYPRSPPGSVVAADVLERYRAGERFYLGFRKKYPGTLGTQWVCGCAKWIRDGESESESEEE
ncbi:hypothetical protein ACN47E_008303 [Coniothyrium glycines]